MDGEAQDVAVDGGDPVDFPVLDEPADPVVDLVPLLDGAADQGIGKEPGGGFIGRGRGDGRAVFEDLAALVVGEVGDLVAFPKQSERRLEICRRIEIVLKQELYRAFSRLPSYAHSPANMGHNPGLGKAKSGISGLVAACVDWLESLSMALLSDCPLFNQLPEAELRGIEAAAQVRTAAPGTVVFQEGDPGDGLYVIIRGTVEVSCMVSPTERRTLSVFKAGEVFGEMAVIDSQPRSATATASAEAELAFLPSMDLWLAFERSSSLAVNLMRTVVHRMREFNQTYTREVVQAERFTLVGRFARSIVHDFKNPLNIIGISADMAAMSDSTSASRSAAAARIRRQVDRLSNMINELLEFTRGSGANAVLARMDYGECVRSLVGELRPEVEARGVQIEWQGEVPSVPVTVDPRRLFHVFHNLMGNACDAMGGPGTIRVRVIGGEKEVVTEIEDTGPGIAPEIASRLFEAFATFGKSSGTGLGLSICKRIVEDHKGRIEARAASGGGAMFSFTLPIAAPAEPAEQERPA
jgi:signal transduction histidine kinase